MDIPKINNRVLQLIDYYTNNSVKKFAENIKIPQQTVNRLFNIDTRTKKYPTATTELLVSIAETYTDVDVSWLLTGRGSMIRSASISTGGEEQDNSDLVRNLLDRIEEQAKQVGRLEVENEILRKKSTNTVDVVSVRCVAVGE